MASIQERFSLPKFRKKECVVILKTGAEGVVERVTMETGNYYMLVDGIWYWEKELSAVSSAPIAS